MGKQEMTSSSPDAKLVHIKVIGGSQADIYEIGQAFKEFKTKLPFKLEAIITNDRIVLQDVDSLITELEKLRRQINQDKRLKGE